MKKKTSAKRKQEKERKKLRNREKERYSQVLINKGAFLQLLKRTKAPSGTYIEVLFLIYELLHVW